MAAQKIKLIGFAPDLPADTPGAIVDSQYVLPTTSGIANGIGAASVAGAGTTGLILGAAALTPVSGSTRYYAGTASKLYALTSSTMTDKSRAAGYSGVGQWTFAIFGNEPLAASAAATLQAQTGTGADFAAVSGAPKAEIVIVAGEPNASFVVCFAYDSGSGAVNDGVFWSALGDYTDWTPSIATECGNVRLEDIGGPFSAAIPFRNGIVAFKKNAMYLGTYVGGAAVWDWQRISSDIGCTNAYGVCEVDDVIWFVGSGGLWTFDGSYPRPGPGFVTDYIVANYKSTISMVFDRANHQVWVSTLKNSHADFLVYNTRSGLWTRHGPLTDGTHYVGLMMDATLGMSDDASAASVMQFSGSGSPPSDPYLRIAALGAPFGMTTLRAVRPQFLKGPSDSTTGWLSGTAYYGPSLRNVTANSAAMSVDSVSTNSRADRLDVMQTARFISPKISISADTAFEVADVYVDVVTGGQE